MSVTLGLTRPLVVRTTLVGDPGDLFAQLPETAPYAWIRHGEGLVAWGEAARVTVPPGPGRFDWARDWLSTIFGEASVDDDVRTPGSGPVAFGSFTFDPESRGSVLVVPQTILARRDGRAWLTTIGEERLDLVTPLRDPGRIRYGDGSLTAPEWEHAVARAVRRIRSGRLEKTVLARDLTATAERTIDVRLLLTRLARRYPDCYTFSCAGLIGATPELLVRRTGGDDRVPGPGRHHPQGHQPGRRHGARRGPVRLGEGPLRAHLRGGVGARRAEPALLRAEDPRGTRAPDAAERPASGQPRDRAALRRGLGPGRGGGHAPDRRRRRHAHRAALDVIRELEGMDRAGYAGPVGWIDARGDGEWGIALRCAQIEGPRARLFAGCGIMGDSDPASELAEAQAKLRVMQYALEG